MAQPAKAAARRAAGGDRSAGRDPEETAYAREVLGALATLPPPVRIAMVMCAVLGWPQAEVAEVLQVPRNTIANRIFRGRAKLAAQLGMTDLLTGVRDPLVPSQGPVAQFGILADDQVGEALARAESWLRAGIEAEPGAPGRMWALISQSASAADEERRWPELRCLIRRLAPGRRGRDLDG